MNYPNMFDLSGKVAVVTGAANGCNHQQRWSRRASSGDGAGAFHRWDTYSSCPA